MLEFVKSGKTKIFEATFERFLSNFEQKFVKIQGLKSFQGRICILGYSP